MEIQGKLLFGRLHSKLYDIQQITNRNYCRYSAVQKVPGGMQAWRSAKPNISSQWQPDILIF